MSLGGKIAVAGSIVFTTSIIYYVFATQDAEQKRMKKGVKQYLKEQENKKSRENQDPTDINMKSINEVAQKTEQT